MSQNFFRSKEDMQQPFDKTKSNVAIANYYGEKEYHKNPGFWKGVKHIGRLFFYGGAGLLEDTLEFLRIDNPNTHWFDTPEKSSSGSKGGSLLPEQPPIDVNTKNENENKDKERAKGIFEYAFRAMDAQQKKFQEQYNVNMESQRNILDSIVSQTAKNRKPSIIQTLHQERQTEVYLPSSIRSRGSTGRL